MNWQISADSTSLIGHMLLRKYYDGEDILGLKVIGEQQSTAAADAHNKLARCGAIVEKVKRGSVADVEGHIRPGKQCTFITYKHTQACRVNSYYFLYAIPLHKSEILLHKNNFFIKQLEVE